MKSQPILKIELRIDSLSLFLSLTVLQIVLPPDFHLHVVLITVVAGNRQHQQPVPQGLLRLFCHAVYRFLTRHFRMTYSSFSEWKIESSVVALF